MGGPATSVRYAVYWNFYYNVEYLMVCRSDRVVDPDTGKVRYLITHGQPPPDSMPSSIVSQETGEWRGNLYSAGIMLEDLDAKDEAPQEEERAPMCRVTVMVDIDPRSKNLAVPHGVRHHLLMAAAHIRTELRRAQ